MHSRIWYRNPVDTSRNQHTCKTSSRTWGRNIWLHNVGSFGFDTSLESSNWPENKLWTWFISIDCLSRLSWFKKMLFVKRHRRKLIRKKRGLEQAQGPGQKMLKILKRHLNFRRECYHRLRNLNRPTHSTNCQSFIHLKDFVYLVPEVENILPSRDKREHAILNISKINLMKRIDNSREVHTNVV